MSDGTKIEWTDATWNVVIGCDKVSPGCDNCYAIRTAHRMQANPDPRIAAPYEGTESGMEWTGRVNLVDDRLAMPLRWRKPRKIFVNAQSDLFHDQVPDEYIARVFAVMALAPQHTFQCLTKRHARMRNLLSSQDFRHLVAKAIDGIAVDEEHDPHETWAAIPGYPDYQASTHGRIRGQSGILSTTINPRTGRYAVTLWNRGAPKTLPVHRLVLISHNPDGEFLGSEACHRNGDKLDNRLANLRWGTRAENQCEKVRHGSRGGPQRLTPDQVAAIRVERTKGRTQQSIADEFGVSRSLVSMIEHGKVWGEPELSWPLSNVWLGVSAENQQWADIRIPALLDTPAAVRFVSAEPLLGPIDLYHSHCPEHDFPGGMCTFSCPQLRRIDWCIVGGESGSGARPMHPDWARSLRDQCQAAGVAFLFKQWGQWQTVTTQTGWRSGDVPVHSQIEGVPHCWMRRVGKKAAGRVLDGRTHDDYPQAV